MRFGTSSSKLQAVGRSLRRFWPAPVFFGLFLLLVVANDGMSNTDHLWRYNDMILYPPLYGILCAILLFSDLFTARYAMAVHALPVTRGTLFVNHILSGLSMFLIPFAAALLLVSVKADFAPEPVLLWMIQMGTMWLYGFTIGTLACNLSGTVFGSIIMALLLAFGVPLVELLIYTICHYLLAGISEMPVVTTFLSPMIQVTAYSGDELSWAYYGGVCIACIPLSLLALLLYRKRELEVAGDFVAFPRIKPWIKGIGTFLGGLALGVVLQQLLSLDNSQGKLAPVALWLLPGVFLARLASEMIVERSVRVMSRKHLLNYLLCLLATAGLMTLVWLDLPGAQTRVPDPEDVVTVEVSENYNSGFWLESPKTIAAATELHRTLTENLEYCTLGPRDTQVTFYYKLKDGSTLTRQYLLNFGNPNDWGGELHPVDRDIADFFNDPTIARISLLGIECTVEEGYDHLDSIDIYDYKLETACRPPVYEADGLLEAIMSDLDTGRLHLYPNYATDNTLYQIDITTVLETTPLKTRYHHSDLVFIDDPDSATTQWIKTYLSTREGKAP